MNLSQEIVERFSDYLDAARAAGEIEPTAMTIATRALNDGVSARTVLLKEFDERGFVFYTNLESNKGRQLAEDTAAALVFHWKAIQKQVLVEGRVERVSDEQADAYFASRPRGSQLGAWASKQSRALGSRAELLKRVVATEARYIGRKVPRPPHWSGFRVLPEMVEFWDGKNSRLHDRFRYTAGPEGWSRQRLFP
ncbi:MAG: pyridoxamine 5'-phosphate oxidase [Xanthomonadales bacterium]|nr:pyridoxamine 5'-phosphate oxidase [Gammaproteobacteria bacterium]NNL95518.1 pyridoxamine 5'-phosphate oxidase [Xanthomonadales bacterium]